MTEKDSAAEKRIAVDYLNFGAKTAKRVAWEAWEFSVESPHLIRVTNASYGFEKDDHSYLVGVEDRDGVPIPAECECPADKYNEEYDCKHKVALATVGGPLVLQAAIDYATPGVDTGETPPQTLEEQLRADGGSATDQCDCDALSDGFPCFTCIRDEKRELAE